MMCRWSPAQGSMHMPMTWLPRPGTPQKPPRWQALLPQPQSRTRNCTHCKSHVLCHPPSLCHLGKPLDPAGPGVEPPSEAGGVGVGASDTPGTTPGVASVGAVLGASLGLEGVLVGALEGVLGEALLGAWVLGAAVGAWVVGVPVGAVVG